jgi:DNA-binding beta-propeller fold protein YncE
MEGLSEGVGGPPFWCIEDCNGGSQSWRKVLLSRLDVTDPESIVVECSQVLSGITVMNQCDSSTVFPNVGLAFSLDGTKLFVVGPDDGLLRVVDTASGAVTEVIGMGPTAVDVAVVRTAGTLGEERAYVLNHGNRTAGIIDVASLTVDGLPIDLNPFGNPSPFFTAITALSNGTKLFVADKANGLLTMVDLDTNLPHDILAGEMKTGNAPRRVFLLRAP